MNAEAFKKLFSDWKRECIHNTVVSQDTNLYNAINKGTDELERRLCVALNFPAPAAAPQAQPKTDK